MQDYTYSLYFTFSTVFVSFLTKSLRITREARLQSVLRLIPEARSSLMKSALLKINEILDSVTCRLSSCLESFLYYILI